MPRGKKLKVVFKQDYRQQGMLIPLDLNDMVAPDHPVRVVNAVLDKVDIREIIKQFRPGGTSSYHPRMLLKVIVFGYINNIYSSRKIEEAVKSNIHFMWLAGMRKPDHNTINRFRGQRLRHTLKPIFNQVVLMLYEEGLLNIRDLYTDGTKIEANANRYTFVWGKAIKTSRERISRQLDELWNYALGTRNRKNTYRNWSVSSCTQLKKERRLKKAPFSTLKTFSNINFLLLPQKRKRTSPLY